jgi:hypothetical protein
MVFEFQYSGIILSSSNPFGGVWRSSFGGVLRFSKLKALTRAGDVQLPGHAQKAWSGPGAWKAANGRQTTTAKR